MLDMEKVMKVLKKTNVISMEVFIIKNLVHGNTNVWQGNKERQDKEVCNEDGQNKQVCNQARQNMEVCKEARQKKLVCNHGTLMHGQQVKLNNINKGQIDPKVDYPYSLDLPLV